MVAHAPRSCRGARLHDRRRAADGTIEAYRLRILQDVGAYPRIGAVLPGFTALMASGVYAIPKIETEFTCVATNTTPIGPFRGAGRPEATQAIERAMDLFAAEIGLDPAEVRRRNFFAADAFPLTTASGAHYDCGDYERRARPRARGGRLRRAAGGAAAAPRARRHASRSASASACTWRSRTASPSPSSAPSRSRRTARPSLRTGSFSHGQGHETTFAMIVADRLGLPARVGDASSRATPTRCAQGVGTYGSKSTQIGGVAARQAAQRGRRAGPAARRRAARGERRRRRARRRGGPLPRRRLARPGAHLGASWRRALDAEGRLDELRAEEIFKAGAPTFPFGAHVAVVEVDTETGSGRAPPPRRGRRRGPHHQPASSPRARCTAAWRPAWRRRCTRSSSTTRTGTR